MPILPQDCAAQYWHCRPHSVLHKRLELWNCWHPWRKLAALGLLGLQRKGCPMVCSCFLCLTTRTFMLKVLETCALVSSPSLIPTPTPSMNASYAATQKTSQSGIAVKLLSIASAVLIALGKATQTRAVPTAGRSGLPLIFHALSALGH